LSKSAPYLTRFFIIMERLIYFAAGFDASLGAQPPDALPGQQRSNEAYIRRVASAATRQAPVISGFAIKR
jgi:hypothetical protein